jgi:nitroreductase
MDLLEAIRRRRIPPDFRPDPVRPEHLKLLIEAAARSPSHFNSQPWRFVIVTDEALRDSLDQLDQILQINSNAPARLGVALNRAEYKPGELQGLYSAITLGAVIQTFALVSASLALGLQWIEMGAAKATLAERLSIPPAEWELVAWFALGYTAQTGDVPAPTPFDTLVAANTWGNPTPEALRHAPSLLWEYDKK